MPSVPLGTQLPSWPVSIITKGKEPTQYVDTYLHVNPFLPGHLSNVKLSQT